MSVYPEAVGHFVPEHLPKALMMHRVLPPGVQILLADSPVAQRYLAPLLASGALPRERVKLMRLDSLRGATVQARGRVGGGLGLGLGLGFRARVRARVWGTP